MLDNAALSALPVRGRVSVKVLFGPAKALLTTHWLQQQVRQIPEFAPAVVLLRSHLITVRSRLKHSESFGRSDNGGFPCYGVAMTVRVCLVSWSCSLGHGIVPSALSSFQG